MIRRKKTLKNLIPRGRQMLIPAVMWMSLAGALNARAQADVKICSASDLHYFAPSLLVKDGTAFQSYLAQEVKLITESQAITEALVAKVNDEKPEILLIPGDLTKDGEKLSHQEMAAYLESIENNGITHVFVVPGNHDVNNVHACSYNGDATAKVDSVSPTDFKAIYNKFGYGEADETDAHSLSYLVKYSAKLWILGIDVCMYDSNMVRKEPVTEGQFKPETYKWVLAKLAEAKTAGAQVIGMMHHGLIEHYAGQSVSFPEYVVKGWDTVSTRFADAGLKLMFTGHYHANDITSRKGTSNSNVVFDIETGSTVTYPCPYRVMHLNVDELALDIKTKYITSITYNTGTLSFPAYAKKTLNDGMKAIVNYSLQQSPYSLPAANAAYLSTYYTNAFLAHYAGDEKPSAEDLGIIDYMNASGGMGAVMGGMLAALWTDLNPKDNTVFLDLNTGLPYQPTSYSTFACKGTEKIGTYSGIDVFETGGSGLTYIPGTTNEFYTLGDRGPNIDAANSAFTLVNNADITDTKIFPFPQYNPKIFRIALRGDSVAILNTIPLKRANGNSVSGLPNPPSLGYAGEGVLTENTQAAHDAFVANPKNFFDTLGIDCEGIVLGRKNDFWIADEYGVSVWNVAANGTLINRYSPYKIDDAQYKNISIDTILAKRRPNRGFENVAITPNGMVYALLQSAMTNPDKKSRIVRMLELNTATKTSKMFAYLLPAIKGVDWKDYKLGDMTAINNHQFLTIAHASNDSIDRIFIVKLDITNATAITAEKYSISGKDKTLESLVTKSDESDVVNLIKANKGVSDITPVEGTVFLELYNESYPAYPSFKNIWNPQYSKPEGLTIVNDSTLAITHDNDFGFASSATADGTVTANNMAWNVFLFNLKGENKIKNFTLDSTIASAMDLIVDASKYSVPTVFAFKKAFATAVAKQDAASVAGLQAAIAGLKNADAPYNIVTSLNGDTKTQLGFAWFTNVGVKDGVVELVEGTTTNFSAPAFTFTATSDSVKNLNYSVAANGLSAYGFTANSKQSYMSNKALAKGLKPGTTYSYRVGKAGAWSDVGSFTTAKDTKDAFSFVYFTDPQANTEAMFDISAKTSHAAAQRYPKTNFWLSCGDLIETSGATNSEWEYERFFESQQDIWLKNPLVAVDGNHDKSSNKNMSYHFNTAKTSFDQKLSTTPGSVYSFVYGDALFMALSYEDYSVTGYLDSLANWMRAQVAAHPEVKWRIAFYHKTMYTGSGSHQSDADGKAVRDRMAPLFDSLQIDVALQGHDHIYEVIGPVKTKQLVDGAVGSQVTVVPDSRTNVTGLLGGVFNVSEGTLYFLNNSAGKKKYEPRSKDQMTAAETSLGISNYFGLFTGRFGQTGEPTFSNVSISTDTIKISTYAVKDDGSSYLFDEFAVVKHTTVSKLAIKDSATSMFVGRKKSLALSLQYPDKVTDTTNIEWKSNNPAVASVQNGVITAVSAGAATIYVAAINGGVKDSCIVTVIAPVAKYVTGDFHQHSTYTDGSYTYGYMTEKNVKYGLDWWANSEHGGGFTTDGAVSGKDVNTSNFWDTYTPNPIVGKTDGAPHAKMWRWQSLRDYEYKEMLKTRSDYSNKVSLQSYEWNVPGHEHGSMGLIAGQFTDNSNCNAIAQFEYMFDNNDSDIDGGVAQGWTKSSKAGHEKTLEALTWLKANYPSDSYVVPAHPERQKKYTIAHFRDMNNTAPEICFGFESMPGHQKDAGRGGYSKSADGGGTYGGCGVYAATVGGLWDAMLSEGRGFWLFANSDAHDISGDFFPGEYQKTYTYTNDNSSAQAILDGLRSGNSWVVTGDLIDSLIFNIAPASNAALTAHMGQSLQLTEKGIDISIRMRDPQTTNNNTYSSYTNPVLHHVDVIMGRVGAKVEPSSPDYNVPSVATTKVIARFDANGQTTDANGIKSAAWTSTGNGWKEMTLHLDKITDSVYFRLRATNLAIGVTNETDAAGNPLADTLMGANNAEKAFDDLWMYSNPIFVAQTKVFVDSISISGPDTIFLGQDAQYSASVYPANASNKTATWSISDDKVLSLTNGSVQAIAVGNASVSVVSEDGNRLAVKNVKVIVPVSSLSLSVDELSLMVNTTSSLTASLSPQSASVADILWKSLNDNIATVNNGTITAIMAGKATIVATSFQGGKSDTCIVTVTTVISVSNVVISNSSLKLEPGKSMPLVATVEPANATIDTIAWTTSNSIVATYLDGKVYAHTVGTTVLTAMSLSGHKIATCVVTVLIQAQTVSLDTAMLVIYVGDRAIIGATVLPDTATNKDLDWSSSQLSVATIDNGIVTAIAEGYTDITVRSEDGNASSVRKVKVIAKPAVTGFDEELSDTFIAYPVPAVDYITCKLPAIALGHEINLLDGKGCVVDSLHADSNTISFDMSSLVAGMYFVVFEANGISYSLSIKK